MSCRPCKDAQDGLTETSSYYFRWGDAIIELRGCHMHIQEVMDWLRKYDADEDELVNRIREAKSTTP